MQHPLKILHVTYTDKFGGAGFAVKELHKSLLDNGVISNVVTHEDFPRALMRISIIFDKFVMKLFGKDTKSPFSFNFLSGKFLKKILDRGDYDIVHLHWLGSGLIDYTELPNLKLPILWSIHDSNPYTGGCHVSGECIGYVNACRSCPKISKNLEFLPARTLKIKKECVENSSVTVLAVSSYIARRTNLVFPNTQTFTVSNIVDTDVFKPTKTPNDSKKIRIGFGAKDFLVDKNKGFDFFISMLEALDDPEQYSVVLFGDNIPIEDLVNKFPILEEYNTKSFGYVDNKLELSRIYNDMNIFVVCSLFESFCKTACEAQSCGVPVIGLQNTGLLDIVEHNISGILVDKLDRFTFVKAIKELTSDTKYSAAEIHEATKLKFSSKYVVENYLKICRDVIDEYS